MERNRIKSRGASEEKYEEEAIRIDRWGFPTTARDPEETREGQAKIKKEGERRQKWESMFRTWERVGQKKLKRRCRKGIPDDVRGDAWMRLSGARALKASNPGLYKRRSREQADPESASVIKKDLNRIYPNRKSSREHDEKLRRVLEAYACHDREIGYCQGMGYIATLFLIYLPEEEDAFWLLVAVMSDEGKYQLRGTFARDMKLVQLRYFQMQWLMEMHIPNLYQHFEEENVYPILYCSKWFMTVFTYNFPFEAVVRIWDVFLSEGVKILFRIGLQCLKNEEQRFLQLYEGKVLSECMKIHTRVDPDTIIERAMQLKLTRAQMHRAELDYNKQFERIVV